MPLISIILIVRNGANFITQALDSIAAQTFQSFEVIVIDDGSDDQTTQLVQNHHLPIKLQSQGPLGIGAALNIGKSLANGEYLSFIDHDDIWPNNRLKELHKPFINNPLLDWVYGHTINTNALLENISPPIAAKLLTSSLIKHSFANQIGAFRTDLSSGVNIDWTSRAMNLHCQFYEIDSLVLYRRIHDSNWGKQNSLQSKRDLLALVREHHLRKFDQKI